jgi:membrane associated rhomboid family serine protease
MTDRRSSFRFVTDLNHILLFVAIISSLLILVRALRPNGANRVWLSAAIIVLVITGFAWLFLRNQSGYIGGGAWFVLLFVPAIGLRKANELAMRGRFKSARQLSRLLRVLHPSAELREQTRFFRLLEQRKIPQTQIPASQASQDRHRLPRAPAVIVFISLNILAFVFELARGDWRDPFVFHKLGSLDRDSVVLGHEYWRLITALFLHYDLFHLGFNLFALYVLGPGLERMIGTVRFVLCYMISGIGSTGGVVLLTLFRIIRPAEVIGASGCVMGIVGAWAGFLLRDRHAPRAKERLLNILLIVAIQIVFDISTPQISMSAHLCGLITGFFVGLILAPKRLSM